MIINNLVTKHTKAYKTEANLIKAVEKKLGPTNSGQYDLIIIQKDGFRPIIKWRKLFQYRMTEAFEAGFYTIG